MGICRKMDSYDISPVSVETANKINKEQGLSDKITCRIGDLNEIVLEKNKIIVQKAIDFLIIILLFIFAEVKNLKKDEYNK